jgi:DNA-binding ferritin-like protein (Dps family)
MDNIFSTLKNLVTGENWKQEKEEYKKYKKRIQALPRDYQIVMKEMEDYLYTFASDTDSAMAIFKVLQDVLELFESSAQDGKDVLDVVGQDVGSLCDDLLHELQVQTWTGKSKEQLSGNIRKNLRKGVTI